MEAQGEGRENPVVIYHGIDEMNETHVVLN